ncbi:acyltransferase [Polaribacter sp. Z014]|uniref:acyltransferase family protein n=1 Tax=Polaribacter sp. Z014 TaxID=2927126 RepID=UPI002020CE03|nr:acyltransferase [Polaribacter sp. Z014]MCL7764554.1 acyltransferase [Polaribacter sp. Z014]
MKKRFYELDAIRGIAIMLVLLSHYTWAFDYHFNTLSEHKFHFFYGDFGVQIFFIISGFVIFMSLQNITQIKQFIIARFSRLYPTYWICMFLTILIIFFFPVPTLGNYTLKEVILNTTMIQGLLKTRHIDQVYWSLGVELIFYFIMGLLFYFKQLKHIIIYCFFWLIICLTVYNFQLPFVKYFKVLLITEHAPLFISGIMFHQIKYGKSNYFTHIIIIMSLMIYLINIKPDAIVPNPFEFKLIPRILVISAYLIFYYISYAKIKILENKILLFIGKISYPLYLLHNVIGYSIIYRAKMIYNNQFFYVMLATLISILLAYFVSSNFEIPISKKVKNKLTILFSYYRTKNKPEKIFVK